MSVIIKNREMPKGCVECWNRFSCKHFEISFIRLNTRHPDCPLIEVPAPHGRLIDADALMKKCQNPYHGIRQWVEDLDIVKASTIIEAEGNGMSEIKYTLSMLPPAQPEQRWIPCSERLPENKVNVLVCFRAWSEYSKRYVYTIVKGWYARQYSVSEYDFDEWEGDSEYCEDDDEYYVKDGWYEETTQGNGDYMSWYINAEVVAWMPLPEHYEEDKV